MSGVGDREMEDWPFLDPQESGLVIASFRSPTFRFSASGYTQAHKISI